MTGKLLVKDYLLYFQQHIDVAHLKAGNYILKIGKGDQIIHEEKLIKR
jgi:hypothetical protein